ncbi:hypothetical protein PENCOP_c002G05733 [Penicillium coprophilum]|uniref:Rhodopsin domain-containing protein n=1 Tax=Penicillium coprophilum TaxID=36646 RepID=A0A1V6V0H3_9EURO|nr:hypothetical protein PENCOP_c002G05733 [Penicillium coprophilum]
MVANWAWDPQHPCSGSALVGANIAITVLQIVFVAARLYTRFMQRAKAGADDYLILLTLAASIAKSVIYIYLVKVGIVWYHFDCAPQTPEKHVLMNKSSTIPSTSLQVKLTLLLFYLRSFTTRKFRILVHIVGSLVLAVEIGVLLEVFLQCRPLTYAWDRDIPGGKCIYPVSAYQTPVPLNILNGLLILVMPIPAV